MHIAYLVAPHNGIVNVICNQTNKNSLHTHMHARTHTHTHTHTHTYTADRAIREMNRKEKDVIRAFFRATKHAGHIESRVRLVISGDRGTGKY